MNGVVINEWLPNPAGNDASGEFVELFNGGSAPVDLRGWTLTSTGLKKRVKLSGTIPANGYLLLPRAQTKLVLKNSDEGIALYDASGKLVDRSSFQGVAPEGKSFNRLAKSATSQVWGIPTPGAANDVHASVVATFDQPFNVPLNSPPLSTGGVIGMMFGAAILLAGLIVYSIKTHEDLSNLFFDRDEIIG